MDIRATTEERAFQAEFCAWLGENLPDEWRESNLSRYSEDEAAAISRQWAQRLGAKGYYTIGWPKAYGGLEATAMMRAFHYRELRLHDAPPYPDASGPSYLGPTILEIGTDKQKAEHLGRISRGETVWVQGFSEPNAGSDLAGLQTRADLDGDEWVINGQKLWSGRGHRANWGFLLARTDQDAPKHRGISMFFFPVPTPGLSVRPYADMVGDVHFTELFFDNMRIPRDSVLGEVNQGWQIAQRLLTYERGVMTLSILDQWELFWQELRDYAASTRRDGRLLIDDERIRERLAETYANLRLMRLSNLRYITWWERGRPTGEETSLLKISWTKHGQALGDLAMELSGPDGLRMHDSPGSISKGKWAFNQLHSRADTIYGGTQDIQRNIIAERILGLPR